MDMTHVSSSVCHSAIRDTRSHRGRAPGDGKGLRRAGHHARGNGAPGNVWPLVCKCSQHLKETIQKEKVIFGWVEEARKQLSAMLSPGAGPWWQLEQQTSLYCYRGPGQGHLPGQWASSTGPWLRDRLGISYWK